MKNTLNFCLAELQLQITTMCMHIRNRAYKSGTPAHQNALQSLLYEVLISDELSILLERYKRVRGALAKSEAGEEFDLTYEEEPVDIYTFCLYEFEGSHCPLGIATAELHTWVSTHADRNQQFREGFEMLYPDVKFMKINDLTDLTEEERELTDSEKFKKPMNSYLRDIGASNALTEFNELMLRVQDLLVTKAPVDYILAALPIDNEQ